MKTNALKKSGKLKKNKVHVWRTYADQQSRDGCAVLKMDHGQQAGQVTLPGTGEAQPAGRRIIQPISSQNKADQQSRGSHLEEVNR